MRLIFSAILFLILTSCSSIKFLNPPKKPLLLVQREKKLVKKPRKKIREVKLDKNSFEQRVRKRESASRFVSSKARRNRKKVDSGKKATAAKLKLNYENRYFQYWVNYFTKRDRERFIRYLKRAARYDKVVRKIFEEHGLPSDLFFVGLIESGFNIHAFSRAKALGPWQFIKGTAKRYGLRVENQVDERRNIHKATVAAANYFKDLYNIFGSWELALCAYNAGEYRIINAIRKGNTRDYRTLVRKKLLPKETIYYIPKVAAARFLAKKHGFRNYLKSFRKESREYARGEVFRVGVPFSLRSLAKKAEISYQKLKKFNPDIRRETIYPGRNSYRLIAPRENLSLLASVIGKFRSNRYAFSQALYYRVMPGDNLSSISLRFNVRVSSLKRWNKIRGSQIFIGQKLVVGQQVRKGRNIASLERGKKVIYHYVKRGQTLEKIARLYGVSISAIRRLNKVRGDMIRVGQKLKIRHRVTTYVVRKGDNLSKIAQRFGTSIRKIMRMNSMKKKIIYPRQEILVPTNG